MIRKALIGLIALTFCVTVLGCGGGSNVPDDAPKAGSRRPAPTEQRTPPGPQSGGAQQQEDPTGGG